MKLAVLIIAITLGGCSGFRFPGVHRINIQQGNFVSQPMIDKLKPGMSKSQVKFVLGQAVLVDSLNQDRWDYVHTIQLAGGDTQQSTLTLYFINNRLDHFEGDYLPSSERDKITKKNALSKADGS